MNITVPCFFASAALAFPLAVISPVFADEVAPPVPLQINDVMPATGFAPDTVTDVMGLRLGMTYDEVEAVLAKVGLPMMADAQEIPDAPQFGPRRLGYHFRTGEVTPGFQWKDGFEMSFAPLRASAGLTMYAEQADAMGALAEYTNGQFLWVSLGGPSVGARVQEIRRSRQIEEPVDTQVMLDSITSKYGPPSRVKAHGSFWIDVAYYYKDGQLVAEGDRRRTKLSLYCKPPKAAPGSADILYSDANVSQWYGAWRDPRLSHDFCGATIFVRLRFGDLPNTIDGLDVAVIDNVALWENANAIGLQAEAVHTEWLESVAGATTAPDL